MFSVDFHSQIFRHQNFSLSFIGSKLFQSAHSKRISAIALPNYSAQGGSKGGDLEGGWASNIHYCYSCLTSNNSQTWHVYETRRVNDRAWILVLIDIICPPSIFNCCHLPSYWLPSCWSDRKRDFLVHITEKVFSCSQFQPKNFTKRVRSALPELQLWLDTAEKILVHRKPFMYLQDKVL